MISATTKRNLIGWLFASPWAIGFVLLFAYPFAASLYWSFCRYDLLSQPEFVGLDNYQRLVAEITTGGRFAKSIWNTFYYAMVSVPLSIVLGIGLATLMSREVKGRSLLRAIFFIPSVVPVVASSILWMWLLDPRSGLVNYLLGWLGVGPQNWFHGVGEAAWPGSWFRETSGLGSKDGFVLMSLWGVGNFFVIYLAAIGDIPKSMYEAAELDGASPLRRFLSITLPMLSPVIFFNLIMGMIQSVQAFTQIYIVSEGQGEPAGASLMLSLHLFLSAFQDLDMGYASAIAWILFVILVVATSLLFRTSRHWVHYR